MYVSIQGPWRCDQFALNTLQSPHTNNFFFYLYLASLNLKSFFKLSLQHTKKINFYLEFPQHLCVKQLFFISMTVIQMANNLILTYYLLTSCCFVLAFPLHKPKQKNETTEWPVVEQRQDQPEVFCLQLYA